MPRYVIATRREARAAGPPGSALDVASNTAGVTVLASSDPHTVTIDTSPEIADGMRARFGDTHIIEPEVRRGLT